MDIKELFKLMKNKDNEKNNLLNEIEELINEYKISSMYSLLEKILKLLSDEKLKDKRNNILLLTIDDKTLFEHLIDYNCFIPLNLRDYICTQEELIKIYLKYNKNDIFKYQKEKIFLQKIDNITLLEHLIKMNLLDPEYIYIINNVVLINLLKKYNKLELLKHSNEQILFSKLDNELVIEYLFKKDLITKETIEKIKNKDIVNIIIKYNKQDLLKYINPEILTKKINKKYILDIILEQNIDIQMQTIYSQELVNMLIEKNRYDLLKTTCSLLLTKKYKNENKTLFEILIEKNIIPTEAIESTKYLIGEYKLIYSILLKYKKIDLLDDAPEESLLNNYGTDTTLLETLLINKIKPKNYFYYEKETYRLFFKYEQFDEIEKCNDENILLMQIDENNLLIDKILKRKLKVNISPIKNNLIIKKILEYKCSYLYLNITTTDLLQKDETNKTYLETILDEFEEYNTDISNLVNDAKVPYELAECYKIYASKDLHMYLPTLTKDDLLQENNNKKLIEVLILKCPEYINKIINKKVRRDLDIALLLKLNGIEQKDIEFESFISKLEKNYLTKTIKEYELLEISKNEEEQLNDLRRIMSDGKEEPGLIDALIASYRHLLHTNSPYAYEVNHLILAKLNNPRFTYKSVKDGAYFTPGTRVISMDDTNIDTLNHETSHALYYFQTNKDIPEELEDEIEFLSNDEEFLNKTYEYSKAFIKLKKHIQDKVEKIFMPKYDKSITKEKIEEIQIYLNMLNTLEREKYLKQGYSEEVLDLICKNTFTVEEYLEQDRKITKENMVDIIMRIEFGNFITIGDILDGIYKGKFKSGILKTKQGIKIPPTYGHGIDYYSRGINTIFDEMIANYGELVKSKKPELGIKYLKKYIGENLYNILKKYYDEQILKNPDYIEEMRGNYGR